MNDPRLSRIGLHVEEGPGDIERMILAPSPGHWAGILALNNTHPLDIAKQAGVPYRVLRVYGTDDMASSDAVNLVLAHDLRSVTHVKLVNESGKGYMVPWQTEFAKGLRAGGFSGGSLALGFSTGNPVNLDTTTHPPAPHFQQLLDLAPAFTLPFAGVALNEYFGVLLNDPQWPSWASYTVQRHLYEWLCLQVHGIATPDTFVLESGLDEVIPGVPHGGWMARQVPPALMLQTIKAVDELDMQFAWFKVRAYYTVCPTPDWVGFDMGPLVADLAAYVRDRFLSIHVLGGLSPVPTLLNMPMGNQLIEIDNNKYNDCGPECLHMVEQYLGVAGESVHEIKSDETGDPNFSGYTDTTEMVQWLRSKGVAAFQATPQDVPLAICDQLEAGNPVIWLSYWDLAAHLGGHFRVAKGCDRNAQTIRYNNPWGGVEDNFSFDFIRAESLSNFIVVAPVVAPSAIPPPTPPVQGGPPVADVLIEGAAARWSAANALIVPNRSGALFKAYVRMYRSWVEYGQDNVLDPTPAIRPEVVMADGSEAFVMLDDGTILHWRRDTGQVYKAEERDRSAIFSKCGWVA